MSKVRKVADADRKATHKAAQARDTWPVRIAGSVSEIADQPPMVALSAGTIVAGAMLWHPRMVRTGLRMLASHAMATGIKAILKSGIDRTRPVKALADGHHIGKGSGSDDTNLNSFPSGHTAGAVAFTEAIVREVPGAAIPARMAAAAIAGIQMPRGKHYVSDVVAGAAIGWASEVAVNAVFGMIGRAWQRRRVDPASSVGADRDDVETG